MTPSHTTLVLRCALACALSHAGYAAADAPPPDPARDAPALAAFGPALATGALATHRGGQQDQYINDMRSRAAISQTSTTQVTTGNNAVSDGAFTNTTGFPMVIQNTGNNVIIQNSTILNLQLK